MLIHLEDHTLVDDLLLHFRRSGFSAESVGGGLIEVSHDDARSADQARRGVLMHLRVWQVTNPSAPTELI
jgi:hypothetical protein